MMYLADPKLSHSSEQTISECLYTCIYKPYLEKFPLGLLF